MSLVNTSKMVGAFVLLSSITVGAFSALSVQSPKPAPGNSSPSSSTTPPVAVPNDYVIGVGDVLTVVFWRDKELSGEVVVRPDGKISLPMLNDVSAVGLTPETLGGVIAKAATKFVRDPDATVIVREIRSRRIYVIGEVVKPGPLQLSADMNVLQALGEAGGFIEGAKKSDVVIARTENGVERRFKFNYSDVVKGKNLQQNIRLLPGDMIIVR